MRRVAARRASVVAASLVVFIGWSPPSSNGIAGSPTPAGGTIRSSGAARETAPNRVPNNSLTPAPARARGYRLAAARTAPCEGARLEVLLGGVAYVGCDFGILVALDARTDRVLSKLRTEMSGINDVVAAGPDAIAIDGFQDGAGLRNSLKLARPATLKPITTGLLSDSTFLGAVGHRAYIDDWCCNGRADEYRPATLYTISLRTGQAGKRFDFAPEPSAHAGPQPLGQGERNYMIPPYFYVVVGSTTYRYDIRHLHQPPRVMASG